jgi:predicted nucleic acid-binding protein
VTPAVIADTGPLVAAFDPDDQYHLRAQMEQHTLANEGVGVFVTIPTLFEAYSLILRRVSTGTAHRWLTETRRQVDIVIPNESDTGAAIELVQRYRDQPITLFDAFLAVSALSSELPVWTYDYHFDVVRIPVWR